MGHIVEFQQRRAKLLANMGEGIAIIPTALELIRNRDSITLTALIAIFII